MSAIKLNNITVYCGSNFGEIPDYYHHAQILGERLAHHNIRLIYGGGNVGLMGTLADSTLSHGGEVIGVTTFLKQKEVAHLGLTELIETPDMVTRKTKLIELADGFIAMAGGLGTYEELFEVPSITQLNLICKPIGLLNVAHFFDPLLDMLAKTAKSGFMPKENLQLLCIADNSEELLHKMANFKFIDAPKWVRPAWLDEIVS
ncbi:TIGR00730 family Rossman fold protein [Moraxella bovis]|uniref:Cytokinin riboside 5'-monophosphate phosphoribohydrolase n=1 Tax=Moraxella bovis TaxID=476 RepID=A0A378PZP5_MORBO|nr:TIGR00730 family Rossman fold protein [Moraxella bovis]STY94020.1 LOG family protein yvdD [Moraxella bovis]